MSVVSIHQFAEKVSLITDITDPVGRAAALQLALQGSYVIGGVPEGSEDDGIAEELRSLGTLASTVEYVYGTEEGARDLLDAVDRTFGRLDLLVNSLKNDTEWEYLQNDDAEPTAEGKSYRLDPITEAARRLMAPRPKPKIVFVASSNSGDRLHGDAAESSFVSTYVSKAADILFPNFRVNAVEMAVGQDGESTVPPDDAARVVLFLLSNESSAVKGQSIRL